MIEKQKYLELLSWQGGGSQRLAFPPWKPLQTAGNKAEIDDDSVEIGVLLEQLNTLKELCSKTVSLCVA